MFGKLPQNFDRCVKQIWTHGGTANPYAYHLRNLFHICVDSAETEREPMKKKKKKKGY